MTKSCFIVLNDKQNILYNKGLLTPDNFSKNRDAQMIAISQYHDWAIKHNTMLLFTNTKRIIYDD